MSEPSGGAVSTGLRHGIRSRIPAGWPETLAVRTARFARIMAGRELFARRDIRCKYLTLGRAGAQFSVLPDLLTSRSVVYSAGIGTDISFDSALIARYGLEVHAFDPTPRSLAWLKARTLPASFHVHEYGFSDYDGELEFAEPPDEMDDCYSVIRRDGYKQSATGSLRRIGTAMAELGHATLDLLKLDIEGSEYGVIRDIVQAKIPIRQLCIEFHHRWPEVGIEQTRIAVDSLRSAGFKIFFISPSGEEYSFLQGCL